MEKQMLEHIVLDYRAVLRRRTTAGRVKEEEGQKKKRGRNRRENGEINEATRFSTKPYLKNGGRRTAKQFSAMCESFSSRICSQVEMHSWKFSLFFVGINEKKSMQILIHQHGKFPLTLISLHQKVSVSKISG